MRNPFRKSSFTTVIAAAAVLVVAGSGTAYAAGLITSAKIKDNTIQSIDVRDNTLRSRDILNNSIAGVDVKDGSLTGADVANGSLTGTDVANNSLTGFDVSDFSLTNQDVGVLFATVNTDGTIANSSGGVTGIDLGTGTYEIDFHRDITNCAFTATVAAPGADSQEGQIDVADRDSNVNAVWVRTHLSDGSNEADRSFHLIVVC